MAALLPKFDPRAFLDAGHGANNAGPNAAELPTLASLAALAGCTPNAENQPARDVVAADPLSSRNPLAGVHGAKVAKPAKDQLTLTPRLKTGECASTNEWAFWSMTAG